MTYVINHRIIIRSILHADGISLQNLAGQDILVMFESNKRLEMPDECPPEVYDIMWKCWAYM